MTAKDLENLRSGDDRMALNFYRLRIRLIDGLGVSRERAQRIVPALWIHTGALRHPLAHTWRNR